MDFPDGLRGTVVRLIGQLDCRGNMDLSVLIRTVIFAGERVVVQIAGVASVADSEPAGEWAETVAKGLRIVETLEKAPSDACGIGARQSVSATAIQARRAASLPVSAAREPRQPEVPHRHGYSAGSSPSTSRA